MVSDPPKHGGLLLLLVLVPLVLVLLPLSPLEAVCVRAQQDDKETVTGCLCSPVHILNPSLKVVVAVVLRHQNGSRTGGVTWAPPGAHTVASAM